MRKPEAWNRRRFVRRAGASLLLGPVAVPWLSACRDERAGRSGADGPDVGAAALSGADDMDLRAVEMDPRAVALSGADDVNLQAAAAPGGAVALLDVGEGPPAAYVSRSRRTVWVDRAWRDRVHFLLGAYTSVSTGLWRLPLPGDDPRAPIAPGDEEREFQAMDLDPEDLPPVPSPGDMRVWPGRSITRRLEAACIPVAPGRPDEADDRRQADQGRWLVGGPWTVSGFIGAGESDGGGLRGEDASQGDGASRGVGGSGGDGAPPRPAGREVFGRVGPGTTHAAPGCSGDGVEVAVFGWRAEAP